ncbi:MAG TPA: hypothetical protein VEA78_04930 [Acidimicrobiales bacterium]|nr:hypothetical protein [Acidimicrobiales bacterium]
MRRSAVLAAALALGLGGTTAVAVAADDPCTDVESTFDPACVGSSIPDHLNTTAGREDPGYAVTADPSPEGAWQWLVGAVHEHSGYSDGDPSSTPRDYFTAARTGSNGTGTGVALDFLWSSEHTDNAQLPITTSAACLSPELASCAHLDDNTHWWKWAATLRQAREATTDEFTAVRGFEWTNDFFNHMNVYFSTNYRNVKIDGSYLSMDVMWDWLQTPVAEGGGADGLVTFNHPGSNPKLSPFDGDLPHSVLLGETQLDNWNEVAYVPAVADRVVGMEVNGGEDIEWFIRALRNGWRLAPVAAEDHHETSWADERDHKTLLLARGRSPQDHYWAFANRRTIAIHHDLVSGEPGTKAVVPAISFSADDGAHVLGSVVSVVSGGGPHSVRVDVDGLPAGYRVGLIGSLDGQSAPVQLGSDGGTHTFDVTEDQWWFAVVCEAGPNPCGSDQTYSAVTAPIWFDA